MNNCTRLIPVYKQLSGSIVPTRTFFCRRTLIPLNYVERQVEDIDRRFARMERDVNAAFRNWGFPVPRMASFFDPRVPTSRSRLFPDVEAETTPPSEPGKPGKYTIKVDIGEGFTPEDISLNLKDRLLTIHAKLEKKSEDGHTRVYQEFSRSFTLPDSVNPEEVKSLFTPDGILTIEANLPEVEVPKPKEIPIKVESKK